MVTFKPEDLYAAGETVSDFNKGLATSVANAVCSLYQASPKGFVTGSPVDAPGQFLRGYWDSFCGRLPEPKLPAPPSRPFTGGQCNCVAYKVTYEVRRWGCRASEEDSAPFSPRTYSVVVFGPVSGMGVRSVRAGNTACGEPNYDWFVTLGCRGNVSFGCQAQGTYDVQQQNGAKLEARILSVVKNDGTADTCGSIPVAYGGGLPAPSNPRTFNAPAPSDAPIVIPYSIDFDPTLIVPVVNVDLNGELEVPVTFDAGGINVDLPDFNVGGGGDAGGISPEQLEALLDAANKIPGIKEALDDLTNEGTQTPIDRGEKNGTTEETVNGIDGILVTVTSFPPGYGRRFGKPELFDFGRATFRRGNYYTESIRLSTTQQWCPADPDSDGYAVSLNPGVKANITVIKREET